MTATPAGQPFEIREHDDGEVHVIALRGELDLATAPLDEASEPALAALAPRSP
jgi:hypothetical protein